MRTRTRALSIFTGAAVALIALAGCSSDQAPPESQVPIEEVQQDKVRLLSADEVVERDKETAKRNGWDYAGPDVTGVQASLLLGECELYMGLAFSSQKAGTHVEEHLGGEPRDRSLVTFKGTASRGDCPENISEYLSGMKVVDAGGAKISEYRQVYLHDEKTEYSPWHKGEPVIGQKGSFRAALEIQADKFSPDMKLVLETPDGDFTVEAQDWTNPSDDYADESLIEAGACLAGEKL